jgi:hypothetical protein
LITCLACSTFACDLCAIYSATQAQGETGKGPFAGFAEQFTYFGTVQVDGEKVPNQVGQYLNSSISQVFAGYNLNDRLGLQFNLPVILSLVLSGLMVRVALTVVRSRALVMRRSLATPWSTPMKKRMPPCCSTCSVG